MIIKQETSTDYEEIYNVVKKAFLNAEHRDGNEQDLVNELRKGDAYIPELSLVAKIDDQIVGHIMFTQAAVGKDSVLVLAPLAVLPEYQRQGIGKALINQGHEIALKLGYEYIVVLGSEDYYPKFGYMPANQLGINIPEGIPTINFMTIKLNENAKAISGDIKYPKEFGI